MATTTIIKVVRYMQMSLVKLNNILDFQSFYNNILNNSLT